MNIKKMIEENFALSIASIVIASCSSGFGLGLGFSEMVRVESKDNQIQLLNSKIKDLNNIMSEKELKIKTISSEMKPFQDNLTSITLENKGLETRLASCNDRVEQWSKALDEWKNAYKMTNTELNNCRANANIFDKLSEIEQKKTNIELKLHSAIENPLDQESIPLYQRQALEYQTRILELERKLISQ